jgi:hypothetical protein
MRLCALTQRADLKIVEIGHFDGAVFKLNEVNRTIHDLVLGNARAVSGCGGRDHRL